MRILEGSLFTPKINEIGVMILFNLLTLSVCALESCLRRLSIRNFSCYFQIDFILMAIKRPWVLSQSTSVTDTRIGVPKCWANHPSDCARNILSDEKIETLIVRSTSTHRYWFLFCLYYCHYCFAVSFLNEVVQNRA